MVDGHRVQLCLQVVVVGVGVGVSAVLRLTLSFIDDSRDLVGAGVWPAGNRKQEVV